MLKLRNCNFCGLVNSKHSYLCDCFPLTVCPRLPSKWDFCFNRQQTQWNSSHYQTKRVQVFPILLIEDSVKNQKKKNSTINCKLWTRVIYEKILKFLKMYVPKNYHFFSPGNDNFGAHSLTNDVTSFGAKTINMRTNASSTWRRALLDTNFGHLETYEKISFVLATFIVQVRQILVSVKNNIVYDFKPPSVHKSLSYSSKLKYAVDCRCRTLTDVKATRSFLRTNKFPRICPTCYLISQNPR